MFVQIKGAFWCFKNHTTAKIEINYKVFKPIKLGLFQRIKKSE